MVENKIKFEPNPDLKLMGQLRETLRFYHYAQTTEKTYTGWIGKLIKYFHNEIHPKDMQKYHIDKYLSYLASDLKVSRSTQRQASNAIKFLYNYVLDNEIEGIATIKKQKKL